MKTLIAAALAIFLAQPAWAQSDSTSIAAFAFGRGKAGAKTAVDVQRILRELVPTTGTHSHVNMFKSLHPGQVPPRKDALEEARVLLEEGKAAYEQLDLEQAQSKLKEALKKYEFGYGFLEKPAPLLECLMYLGATWVLVGEPERAQNLFTRAQDLPGRKVLDPNLFPPNIQDIFSQAAERAQQLPKSAVNLVSTPQGAEILVDESYRGGSPAKVGKLRVGIHLVRAQKDGYLPWGGRINVAAGKHKQLRLKLKPARKQKAFSRRFRLMAAEVIRNEPGDAIEKMGKFLKTNRIAVVAAKGNPEALELIGYLCELGGEVKCASGKKTLNTSSAAFRDELKQFCLSLLKATPQSEVEEPGAGFAEGAAAAAALLENADKGGEEGGGEGMGLDLGAEAKPPKPEEDFPDATADDLKSAEAAEKKEKELEASLKEQKKKEDDDGTSPSTWGYLTGQWWFWTAVGVVAAGAATGTYFLVSGGSDDSTGNLVLNLH
ncbi:PEGA domain-containing protein [Myxococcota bacterium]